MKNGAMIGRTTSGGYGWRVGKSLALAMVKPEFANVGDQVEVRIFGEALRAIVIPDSPYDPKNAGVARIVSRTNIRRLMPQPSRTISISRPSAANALARSRRAANYAREVEHAAESICGRATASRRSSEHGFAPLWRPLASPDIARPSPR